jgi:predicted component of viral defense system (DUF524 family)
MRRREILRAEKRRRRYKDADEETRVIERLRFVIEDCRRMKMCCLIWSSEPFLARVGVTAHITQTTQFLLKNPFYSRFYHLYLESQQQLKTSLNAEDYVTTLMLRKVSELYEMWSVFYITRMAVEVLQAYKYTVASNQIFFEIEKDYFQFDVRKNVASIVLIKNDVRIEIKYEPIYPNYQTVGNVSSLVSGLDNGNPLTPDMVIEVSQKQQIRSLLVFDAKYRWQKGKNGAYYPHQEAINKMHLYHNTILYKQYDPQKSKNVLHRIVSSAYILFPGNILYREPSGGVGALPLFPDMAPKRITDAKETLKTLLLKAQEHLESRSEP